MKHGSLFSGIGGFDLAAEWMGWENVFHCEWNPFGQKVLKHYWPKAISYEDITKTDFYIHRGNIDIITGGFPCQPYSAAGKRLGKEDERHLWPEMLRAIREIKPRWVVGENVYGLVNWSGGLVFHEVQADLEAEGYEVQPYLLPAVSVNAPHRRDRIWFVAHSKNINANGCTRYNSNKWAINTEKREEIWSEFGNISIKATPPNTNNSRADIGMRSEREWKESNGIGGLAQPKLGQTGRDGDAADTNSNGQHSSHSQHEINASEGGFNAQRDFEQSNGDGDAADTLQVLLQQCEDGGEMGGGQSEVCGTGGESANGIEANGEVRDVADTNGIGLRRQSDGIGNAGFIGKNSKRSDWSNFPSVSPVCVGNDGFSDRLDGITFSKWRNESIKAGGNAVCPPLVYQIFKTIEAYEKMGI